jgi:hypothetical protein
MKIILKTVRPEPVEGLSFYFAPPKEKAVLRQAQDERVKGQGFDKLSLIGMWGHGIPGD